MKFIEDLSSHNNIIQLRILTSHESWERSLNNISIIINEHTLKTKLIISQHKEECRNVQQLELHTSSDLYC